MRYLKKFGAVWCGPCRGLDVVLDQIDFTTTDVEVEKIDIDSLQRIQLQSLGIRGVPTMILFDEKGTELSRKTGTMSAEALKEWLEIS